MFMLCRSPPSLQSLSNPSPVSSPCLVGTSWLSQNIIGKACLTLAGQALSLWEWAHIGRQAKHGVPSTSLFKAEGTMRLWLRRKLNALPSPRHWSL